MAPSTRLVLCVGPSGAGKDTLLLGARHKLKDDPQIIFIHRCVTRLPNLCTPLEVSVTNDEFRSRSEAGDFALEWHAHDTHYGILLADLDKALTDAAGSEQSSSVVLNVSRSIIGYVHRKYEKGLGYTVVCLNITASQETLKKRLLSRGRESGSAVGTRLNRSAPIPDEVKMIHLQNDEGLSVEEGTDFVVQFMRGHIVS